MSSLDGGGGGWFLGFVEDLASFELVTRVSLLDLNGDFASALAAFGT